MKRTMMGLCLAALLVLPLAGCSSDKTGSGMNDPVTGTNPPGGGITSGVSGQGNTGGTQGDQNPGDDDLAGADGVVGGQGAANSAAPGTGTGTTGTAGSNAAGTGAAGGRSIGQATQSPVGRVGQGVEDALDDMGDAARSLGRDARRALQ